nr:hypothetical protein [Thermosulfurimonas marina]
MSIREDPHGLFVPSLVLYDVSDHAHQRDGLLFSLFRDFPEVVPGEGPTDEKKPFGQVNAIPHEGPDLAYTASGGKEEGEDGSVFFGYSLKHEGLFVWREEAYRRLRHFDFRKGRYPVDDFSFAAPVKKGPEFHEDLLQGPPPFPGIFPEPLKEVL